MKITLFIPFLFLHLFLFGQKSVEDLLEDGFQESGKKAIKIFTKVIELDSNNAEAYWRRAHVYYRMKKYNKALDDLNKSLLVDSTFTYDQVISDRGQTKEMLKNYSEAILDFTAAINFALLQDTSIPQGLEKYYYHRARTKLKNSDTSSALYDLDCSLYYWQSHFSARMLRAKVNTALGNYTIAMADYNYLHERENIGMDIPNDKEYADAFYYRSIAKQNTGDDTFIDDLKISEKYHYYLGKVIYVKGL